MINHLSLFRLLPRPANLPIIVLALTIGLFVLLIITTPTSMTPDYSDKPPSISKPIHANNSSTLPPMPQFTDATLASGIDFIHIQGDSQLTGLNEVIGSGVCAFDYNQDDWVDVFFVGGPGPTRYFGKSHWWQTARGSQLYKNLGHGQFIDVTKSAGLQQQYWGMGCTTGDLDNDGYPELFVTTHGQNYLYHNLGDGRFSDISVTAGIANDIAWSTTATMADYDNDGLLDIYVVNYLRFDKSLRTFEKQSGFAVNAAQFFDAARYDSEANRLYHNIGQLQFRNTAAAGVANISGRGLSATWTDINQDQHQDLIVINDVNSPNVILLNQGDGTFANANQQYHFGDLNAAHDVAIADFNNDSINDILTVSQANQLPKLWLSAATPSNHPSINYQEQAYAFFQSIQSLMAFEIRTVIPGDINNDGYLDIFMATGKLTPDIDSSRVTVGQQNQLWLNQQGRQFIPLADHSNPLWFDRLSSRGAAMADFDNDGDLDIMLTHNNDMAQYLRNDTPLGHWLRIQLVTEQGNRDAIGAKLWLSHANTIQYRELTNATSVLSASSNIMHFGLGQNTSINPLKIRWPNGQTTHLEIPQIDTHYIIDQSKGIIATHDAIIPPLPQPLSLLTLIPDDDTNSQQIYLEIIAEHKPSLFATEINHIKHHPNPSVRNTAIRLLTQSQSTQHLQPLIEFLNDTDPANVIDALQAVAAYEDETSMRWLLRLFNHPDATVRLKIILQFIRLFEKEEAIVHRKFLAVPSLIHALSDNNPSVRLVAIEALGVAERYRGVNPLIHQLQDHNIDIQSAAATALGKIREQSAIPALLQLAQNVTQAETVRAQALIALKRINYPSLDTLIQHFYAEPLALSATLQQLGPIYYILTDTTNGIVFNRTLLLRPLLNWTHQHLTQLLMSPEKTTHRYYFFLVNNLAIDHSQAAQSLLQAFAHHEHSLIRTYTYNAILDNRVTALYPLIINALNQASPDLQRQLLIGLTENMTVLPLPKTLSTKLLTQSATQQTTIEYYQRVAMPVASDALLTLITDNNEKFTSRISALKALAKQPNPLTIPDALLSHNNPPLRRAAIHYWINTQQQTQSSWMAKPPLILATLIKHADFDLVLELIANRREPWARHTLIELIKNTQIPLELRQGAIDYLLTPQIKISHNIIANLLIQLDPPLQQILLKHNHFVTHSTLIPYLQQLADSNLALSIRLLAAKRLIDFDPQTLDGVFNKLHLTL